MKTAIWTIVGVIIIAAIIVVGLFFFGFFSANHEILKETTPAPSPNSTFVSSPLPPTISPPVNSIPIASSNPSTPVNQTPISRVVNFDLSVTRIFGGGLSRTVTWQITNSGTINANNVSVIAQIYSQGSLIKVNGLDSIVKTLGTIKAGETVIDQITLSFGILDAPKILLNGVAINLTLSSDEKTQTITYDYQP